MAIFQAKIIVWSINIGRYHRREFATVLDKIAMILNIDESFSIRISEIGMMRRTIVDLVPKQNKKTKLIIYVLLI